MRKKIGFLKKAIAKVDGYFSPKGEKLASARLTPEEVNAFNGTGKKAAAPKKAAAAPKKAAKAAAAAVVTAEVVADVVAETVVETVKEEVVEKAAD